MIVDAAGDLARLVVVPVRIVPIRHHLVLHRLQELRVAYESVIDEGVELLLGVRGADAREIVADIVEGIPRVGCEEFLLRMHARLLRPVALVHCVDHNLFDFSVGNLNGVVSSIACLVLL